MVSRYEELKSPALPFTRLDSQYKELQTVTLPFLQEQLKRHLKVWRDQLPEFRKVCNVDQGAGSSIVFKIDQQVFKQLIACGV